MAHTPLDIKIEVDLDNSSTKKYYYPGDTIEGKIFITANQNYSLSNLRLAWTGRISVQPTQSNKDFRIYFDECWKLGPLILKSPKKTLKGSTNVPFYKTQLISANDLDAYEPKVDLPKNKTIGLTFQVQVPNDRPLPSSTTEGGGSPLNKIIYLLEAFIDQEKEEKPVFFGQRVVPVFEAVYTKVPEMMTPQRAEQVFVVSLSSQERKEFTSAMRVTLPCRGCQPGIVIPVSISIWNNMEFSRKQGISISLFRVNHVLANGRAYTSPGEKVHRVVTDLNITSDDTKNHQKVQTVRIGLPIPTGTMPTVSLVKSELLAVTYFIRVQIFAQEGVYTTAEGTRSQFMMVDLPFIVGTLSTPTSTPISSPVQSNFSDTYSVNHSISPLSSPTTATAAYLPGTSFLISAFAQNGNRSSAPAIISSTPRTSTSSSTTATASEMNRNNSDTSSIKTVESKKSGMSGIFRKASSGSASSSTTEKKKKNVFSTLRLYGRKSKDNGNSDTESMKQKDEDQSVSPAVVMTPKSSQELKELMTAAVIEEKDHSTSTSQPLTNQTNSGGGVFNLFPDDDPEEEKEEDTTTVVANKEEKKDILSTTTTTTANTEKVFKMFPDEDSDDEEENTRQAPAKTTAQSRGVFNMFPDDSEDEDDINTAVEESNLSPAPPAPPAPERLVSSSNVFQMFGDSDSDEEEIQDLSISQQDNTFLDERVKPSEITATTRFDEFEKPNAKEYKPDTIDITDHNSTTDDDSEDEDDEGDILGALARREKLLQQQQKERLAA